MWCRQAPMQDCWHMTLSSPRYLVTKCMMQVSSSQIFCLPQLLPVRSALVLWTLLSNSILLCTKNAKMILSHQATKFLNYVNIVDCHIARHCTYCPACRWYWKLIMLQGWSGRALRKLPFLAHAQMEPNSSSSVAIFLSVLHRSALEEIAERSLLWFSSSF